MTVLDVLYEQVLAFLYYIEKVTQMRLTNFAYGAFALVLFAGIVQAGSMATTLVPVARLDPVTFADLGPIAYDMGRVANGQPGVYQVQVLFTAVKDAGEKGWANTLFDMATVGPGLALRNDLGYDPNAATFDSNGALPGGVVPIFGTNTDAGAPGDLKGILASIASATLPSSDGRNQLGTAAAPAAAGFPTYIGQFFVQWDGNGLADLNAENQQYSFTTEGGTFAPVQAGNGATLGFGSQIPEPSSVALVSLLSVAIAGLVRRRS